MEFLEGESLTERLDKEALRVTKVLQIATQIASALDRHIARRNAPRFEAGNIMLTSPRSELQQEPQNISSGRLLLMRRSFGFGVARASEGRRAESRSPCPPRASAAPVAAVAVLGCSGGSDGASYYSFQSSTV